MYSRDGVLPNKVINATPFSSDVFTILTSFDGVIETRVFFYFALVCAVMFTLGWKTRLFKFPVQPVFSVSTPRISSLKTEEIRSCASSWHGVFSCLWEDDGGIDSLQQSMNTAREFTIGQLNRRVDPVGLHKPIFNLVVFAVLCQLAVIYFFNTVSKNGPTWRDGTALYYILHMDRQITEFAVWCRERVPLRLNGSAHLRDLGGGGLAAPLIMSPIGVTWCRRVAVVSLIGLHIGIALWMNVGLFSWAMICAYPLLLSRQDFELGTTLLGRLKGAPLSIQLRERSGLQMKVAAILKRMDRFQKLQFTSGDGWSVSSSRGEQKGECEESVTFSANFRLRTGLLPGFWVCWPFPGSFFLMQSSLL